MRKLVAASAWAALTAGCVVVSAAAPLDDAARFGMRETVLGMSLSPDGSHIAFVTPMASGQGSALYVQTLDMHGPATKVAEATGKPERLGKCSWVSDRRLVCQFYGVTRIESRLVTATRMVAVDIDGSHAKILSVREGTYSRGFALDGGSVIDWLPDESGKILMTRAYLPDDHTGSLLGSKDQGLGVDRVDTNTLAVTRIEKPSPDAVEYISDGRGTVRIKGLRRTTSATGMDSGVIRYVYRETGSTGWKKLSDYDGGAGTGFNPYAVDHDRNVAYGFKKKTGRLALYSITLDGSLQETEVFARPDVDVDELIRIGRRERVVGVSYAGDVRQPVYFDPAIAALASSLAKALPKQPLVHVVDASVDESKLLIFAGSDDDPGAYYVLDRKTKKLNALFDARGDLAGQHLATVRPIRYPAADGTMVPGYLTLPPGMETAKGLPAIVLPHGGPSARDEWGFDWLPQFFAARGYAVLQPNYRGSTGYGDAWFQKNGFRSWPQAISDVLDAGRWLVKQGTANPSRLAIVGWSYGGYAALQSAVVDQNLFKAVVAIAPVTDLANLKLEANGWSDAKLVADFVGDGPHIKDGSPARNAPRIKVPVLLFHGTLDRNVSYAQSRLMDTKLEEAGGRHQLVTFEGLDHYLDDSVARAAMLRQTDEFLRKQLAM